MNDKQERNRIRKKRSVRVKSFTNAKKYAEYKKKKVGYAPWIVQIVDGYKRK